MLRDGEIVAITSQWGAGDTVMAVAVAVFVLLMIGIVATVIHAGG